MSIWCDSDRKDHQSNAKRLTGGFTLLELITVIAIIGILSSIVMVSLGTAREKARDGRRIAEVKNLQLALDFYFEVNSSYPNALSTLSPTYISVIPTDPLNGSDYIYVPLAPSGSDCFDYHLGTVLEDSNSSDGSDADASPGTVCGAGADFHGDSVSCTGTTATSPDMCYDVKAQ
ncbi:MAG: prepilin-type N-terminal cleavage/methylation domain-containing protein, partial [Anaerolineales bacterium]|nr:prepilin-type N-terminal cleavage/methylation domain-containing protein [Anaerolineales bacterium]